MTQKILAKHAGLDVVEPGQIVWVSVDIVMTHDVCGPGTFGIFKEKFGHDADIFHKDKLVLIPDHYIFTEDEKANRNIDLIRDFATKQNITHFYDVDSPDYRGVCHVTLPYEGHCRPGEIILGTDSHTCTHGAFGAFSTGVGNTEGAFALGTGKIWLRVPETILFRIEGQIPKYIMAKDCILQIIGKIGVEGANYKTMQFIGDAVTQMNIDEKMTLCNMAVEAGAKNGIIPPDETVIKFVKARTSIPFEVVEDDPEARFENTINIDVENLEPVVAKPHSPDNIAPVSQLKDEKIDRVYIGSCTGGKTTDFIRAAQVLAGNKIAVPTFVVPATTFVADEMEHEKVKGKSLRQIFSDAGCQIGPPSCAACLGGPLDTFGRLNEPLRCISTTNRNFPGRMGHAKGEVFLASPLTAAASALTGKITDPRDHMQ
jgi:3-isopropylmalate/(R)-2-methylmalate dehydratase large subunit